MGFNAERRLGELDMNHCKVESMLRLDRLKSDYARQPRLVNVEPNSCIVRAPRKAARNEPDFVVD